MAEYREIFREVQEHPTLRMAYFPNAMTQELLPPDEEKHHLIVHDAVFDLFKNQHLIILIDPLSWRIHQWQHHGVQ